MELVPSIEKRIGIVRSRIEMISASIQEEEDRRLNKDYSGDETIHQDNVQVRISLLREIERLNALLNNQNGL
jgi:uncharacterized small protein (DUF1192 family)